MNGARRHRGRKPDQGERAAPAYEGKSARRRRPMHKSRPIGVPALLLPREHRRRDCRGLPVHVGWSAERRQPGAAADEFLRERDIGEVAGDSDGAGRLRVQVGDDLGQHGRIVDEAAPPLPVDVAGHPLADEFAPARRRQRRQMRAERWARVNIASGSSPLRTSDQYPATNTSTPPTTTWKEACRNGVSM